MSIKPKILVIVGPTATGKSDLAVKLAKELNGEVVSADSRQFYKGLDIGSGKITKKEMCGVPHHLLDVANPKRVFSVAQFKKLAEKKITEILSRKKLPIICGGTGFYIDTLVSDLNYPKVKPNKKLRAELEKKTAPELLKILKKLDRARAKSIDSQNKVRLVRAIEIAKSLGHVPKIQSGQPYDTTFIGLDWPDLTLQEHIRARLKRRLKGPPSLKLWRVNMVAEVAHLQKSGVSYRRLESLGLEYKNCALFLQKKISKNEMIENILKESFQYAKRQRTWFKRNKDIKWYNNGYEK